MLKKLAQRGISKIKKKLHSKKLNFKLHCKIYNQLNKNSRFTINKKDLFPCLNDATGTTSFEPHYLYHCAWAARVLAKTKPIKHIDISSSLNFVSIASSFVPIDFYDYRPADIHLDGLACKKGDLLSLPFEDNSVASISCMHVIEHIGLGRYGDTIDPDGDIKAIKELTRVVAPGGDLIFVVPLAEFPRLQFNAHRVYSYDMILGYFKDFKIMEFTLIKSNSEFIRNANKDDLRNEKWGCGCFWLKKKENEIL